MALSRQEIHEFTQVQSQPFNSCLYDEPISYDGWNADVTSIGYYDIHLSSRTSTPVPFVSKNIPQRLSPSFSSHSSGSLVHESESESFFLVSSDLGNWEQLLSYFVPPVEASHSDFHRKRQLRTDLHLPDNLPSTNVDEFTALWYHIMSTRPKSTSAPQHAFMSPREPGHEGFLSILHELNINIICGTRLPTLDWFPSQHKSDVEGWQTERVSRLYCNTDKESMRKLSTEVTMYVLEKRSISELRDLLTQVIFLRGNSYYRASNDTNKAESSARLCVRSESLQRACETAKPFLLPPIIPTFDLPSTNKTQTTKNASVSHTESMTTGSGVLAQTIRTQTPVPFLKESQRPGHRPSHNASQPNQPQSPKAPIQFPNSDLDLMYWLDTKHQSLDRFVPSIEEQTFVLPSHHTSPYLTIVFDDTHSKDLEFCTRYLKHILAIKGGAALYTRYELRRETSECSKKTAMSNSGAPTYLEPEMVKNEIRHYGVTVNGGGGYRLFLLEVLEVNTEDGLKQWNGVQMTELHIGSLRSTLGAETVAKFVNNVHSWVEGENGYLHGLLRDLEACCLL